MDLVHMFQRSAGWFTSSPEPPGKVAWLPVKAGKAAEG